MILLIAIDSGFYFQLAYNLAVSIKSNRKTGIALLTDDKNLSHLSDKQKQIFDIVIEAKEEDYLEDYLINPFMLKTRMYDYTPFENTLYLDADQLFLREKTVDELFYELAKIDFQIHEVNRYDLSTAHNSGMIWTEAKQGEQRFKELWELYDLSPETIYPEYNSSFIWFRKNDKNKVYFDKVKQNYFDRRIAYKEIGRSYPDEMAWNISGAQLNHYSGKEKFQPCYHNWESEHKDLETIEKNYYLLSMASGYQPSKQIMWYDNLVKQFRANAGDTTMFRFEMNKKIFFRK